MMGAVHLLPGSHFSNIFERGDLDAEAEAVMTLRELEVWLALEITGSYHVRAHRALDTTPIAVWAAGVDEAALRMPADPKQFLVDFLPSEQRVLQRDGLHLFHIRYWSDELRWLMGNESRKFTLKYDPRDLSRIFVLTEDGIIEARPADLTRPAITLWEHRAARRALREAGRRSVDEELIFSTILAQRDLVDSAATADQGDATSSGAAFASGTRSDDRRDASSRGAGSAAHTRKESQCATGSSRFRC